MPVFRLTPAIKLLLLINIAFFAVKSLLPSLHMDTILGLHNPGSDYFQFWQPLTHVFMHADLSHIFLNMLGLVIFGVALEERWGQRKFILYFMVCALGGAALFLATNYYELLQLKKLINAYTSQPDFENLKFLAHKIPQIGFNLDEAQKHWMISPELFSAETTKITNDYYKAVLDVPCVGASGGVYGVLLAYGMLFPFSMLFGIPARIAVALFAIGAILQAIENNPNDSVAHFAHLGGMLFGYLLLKIWNENNFDRFRIK